MKRIALIIGGIVIVIGLGYLVSQQESTVEVDNSSARPVVQPEPTIVNHYDVRIEEAKEAEMDRINQAADEMRQDFVDNELAEIEARIWREIASEAEAKAVEKEKESGEY